MALSFTISHDCPYNRRIHDYDNARIGTLDVTEATLYNILKSLDISTATGLDGLGNILQEF